MNDKVTCPYCKGTGKYDEWYNSITGDTEQEDCDACMGTKWCEKELAEDYVEREY